MTEIIEIGRNSDSRINSNRTKEKKYPNIKRFEFSEKQGKAIAERRLYQLTKLNVKEVEDGDKLQEAIKDINRFLIAVSEDWKS